MKAMEKQKPATRRPRQNRSLYKVELIFEAALRLLEAEGLGGLTTNAIAAAAGVSIGTLYQYFPNKAAILDALADREMAALSDRVLAAVAGVPRSPEQRIAAVVGAVTSSYGGRHAAHAEVMAHSLTRTGHRLGPLFARLIDELGAGRPHRDRLNHAEAFVLTHAIAGVLRAMTRERQAAQAPAIEQALVRLVTGFVGADRREADARSGNGHPPTNG